MMISSRRTAVAELAVTIRPPFELSRECSDGALDLGGVAHVDRTQLHAERRRRGLDGGELADPAVIAGSRSTAARVTRGAISLSSSSNFPLILYSNGVNPMALLPGPRQARDEARADRVDDIHEHNRHGTGRF